MQVDYIIVGLGLAGLAFSKELEKHNKTYVIFEDNSQTSSLVAGGVYNPVILKRFTPVWNAKEQLEVALPFYKKIEEKLNITIDQKFVIKKAFKSVEDQNNWFGALDKPKLIDYLDPKLDNKNYNGVLADFSFGNVKPLFSNFKFKLPKIKNNYLLILIVVLTVFFSFSVFIPAPHSILYSPFGHKVLANSSTILYCT